jgi:2-aminoethylphosphonate-pyruvate transaminase
MISLWKDKALFTPGPLTTSRTVKQAMLRDLGSRDAAFIAVVREVRRRLVELGGVDESDFTAVLVQGSGTFGLEAVVSSVLPPDGRLLVLINGAYGERILRMAEMHRIPATPLRCAEDTVLDPEALHTALVAEPDITHVAVVHCETTTGIINPIAAYGDVVRFHGRSYIVDAMSSFGAYPVDLGKWGIDYLVSSSNKCIESVPGFSFVLARQVALLATRGFARTLSLDLLAQWEGLQKDGQFRFTPPTHAILAFDQALRELEAEGGVMARARRYQRNYEIAFAAMQEMGFRPYLMPEHRGYIITAFRHPDHPRFDFRQFYERLSDKGHVIYPGKLSNADCFRIGHIGRLDESDVHALMSAIKITLAEMDIQLSV